MSTTAEVWIVTGGGFSGFGHDIRVIAATKAEGIAQVKEVFRDARVRLDDGERVEVGWAGGYANVNRYSVIPEREELRAGGTQE